MTKLKSLLFRLFVGMATVLLVAADLDAKDNEGLIDALVIKNGVTVTEIEESGRKRFEFTGSHAETLNEDVMRVYNVRATIIQEDGREILVMTEVADYNAETRQLDSDRYVEIISSDGVMTGIGMHLDTEKKKLMLLKDVDIQIDSTRKSGDLGFDIL